MKQIPLTQGYVTLVDDEDYDWLTKVSWRILKGRGPVYARNHRYGQMHRAILNAQAGHMVDHINGNSLDNQRANLRLASSSQNQYNQGRNRKNTSGYKGVDFHKSSNLWRASIRFNNTRQELGYFKTPEAAHAAYCEAAMRLHGEFARTE